MLASGNSVGIEGDINMDGKIDVLDLAMLGKAWGSPSDPKFNGCADLNHDGKIDVSDLAILGQHWGEEGFYTKAIPDESGLGSFAWLKGSWSVDEENKLTLDCKEVGVQWLNPLVICSDKIRVKSEGDIIGDTYLYKDVWEQQTEEIKDSTSVTWYMQTIGRSSESWRVIIEDNGDRYVKLVVSTFLNYGGPDDGGSLAYQEIEIKW